MVPSTAGVAPYAAFVEHLARLREVYDRALAEWLEAKTAHLGEECPESMELAIEVHRLVLSGGKRLRPVLVERTYEAFGGQRTAAVRPPAMATELLHAYLLIHDDIMDHAELRRGQPTVHAAFRQRHKEQGWHGNPEEFGHSMAILAGDLAHTWAVELVDQAPVAEGSPEAVRRSFAAMSEEVIAGQYLEMLLPFRERTTEAELTRVLRLKSGRYSIERPIELGARLAGANDAVLSLLADYGQSLGEAFQLRDDVLGIFGNTEAVGKSTSGDLAEGKRTFLIHFAVEQSSDEDRRWLLALLRRGRVETDEAHRARQLLRDTGALEAVETMIAQRLETARRALASLEPIAGLGWAEHRTFFEGLLDFLKDREQ